MAVAATGLAVKASKCFGMVCTGRAYHAYSSINNRQWTTTHHVDGVKNAAFFEVILALITFTMIEKAALMKTLS